MFYGLKKGCLASVFSAFLLLAFFLPAPAAGAEPQTTTAVKIVSGDRFILGEDRCVKLEGIMAPGIQTQALAEQARAALEKLTTGKQLMLENISTDRYGRTVAEVFATGSNGARVRLQEAMLREGMAFVYPPTGLEPGLDALFAAENEARAARRGIWADDFYADTPDKMAARHYGHFLFARGTVLTAQRAKDKVYLNFGDDWKKDFTVIIAAHDLAAFRKAGVDPLAYEGKTIRVRGWMVPDNGPKMTVTTPAQIQIIGKP